MGSLRLTRVLQRCCNGSHRKRWTGAISYAAGGDFRYPPLYLFLDELGAVVDRYPNTPLYLADVLRRGRAVQINVDTNNQGFLNRDVELKGSSLFNFNTAFHLGGSPYSASKVLETPLRDINTLLKQEEIPGSGLGKGIALLRQTSVCPTASLVRLPFPAPDYAVRMLGRADDWVLPELRNSSRKSGNGHRNSAETGMETETPLETAETTREATAEEIRNVFPVSGEADVSTQDVSAETRETIKRLYQGGMSLRDIAPLVGMPPGRKYKKFQHVCRELGIGPGGTEREDERG